jgi:predicted Rdx family selenoprotein
MSRASPAFEAAFTPDVIAAASVTASQISEPYLGPLLAKWGGTSFNGGIYRLIRAEDVQNWVRIAEGTFPSFRDRLVPFGIDWLGRLFALDLGRTVTGSPGVTLLEPGTGAALEIPCTAESFHESELIEYREEALAASFLEAWLRAGGTSPGLTECVAYRQPLFLGGSDTVENLELADLQVYWGLAEQLIQKVRGLPLGTVVEDVSLRK